MLTEREERILTLIVEEYIKLTKPVSSNLICKRLKCSSATVRSEMKVLEDIGLLEKTHTSSGREDMYKLKVIFDNQQLNLSDTITKSLQVVSDMTNYTTVVLGSTSHDNLLKQIEVVPINDEYITVIVITDKGHVQHKTINLKNVDHEDIKKTVGLINNLIIGTPIDEVSQKLEFEVKPIIGKYVEQHEQIYNAFYNVFTDFTSVNSDVSIVGKDKILDQPEFTDSNKMRQLYSKLENKETIENIREIHKDDNNNIEIYIGEENKIDNDVTVIKTTYKTENDNGTIAIIGPKRMDYERVVSMLEYIKKNIER